MLIINMVTCLAKERERVCVGDRSPARWNRPVGSQAEGIPPGDVARNLGVSIPPLYHRLPAAIL